MAEELKVQLPPNIKGELDKMAGSAGMSTEKLTALLMEAFVDGDGKVFSAPWKEGPGIRLLPDWPRFSAKVFRLKKEELR